MYSERIIFSTGVLLAEEGTPTAVGIRWAKLDEKTNKLTVKNHLKETEEFDVTRLTQSPRTDRIEFVSNDVRYRIRDVREEDGIWLSSHKTPLPIDVLERHIQKGENVSNESLIAYMLDDSPYVVALKYESELGHYIRMDGAWVLVSPTDMSLVADNMVSVSINLEKADEFIDLYDVNYVSVSDLSEYESADSGSPEQSDD
jgi:hypothetical protein